MACGSVLSDKALARFRTKPCERLLAQGKCDFQDKCQYSHSSWVRRNPCKVAYQPIRCNKENCPEKRQCRFAHSEEEVLYHPLTYKVSMCGVGCRGFYCPFAHGRHELRSGVEVAVASGLQQLDASYNPRWLEVEEQQIGQLDWLHPQTGFAVAATGLYGFDMLRFLGLVKPTATEALIAVFVYLGLYASRLEEVKNMDKHYQVSFYASIGWTIYALASLFHALSCGPEPPMSRDMAESLHTVGAGIFLLSCGYFYSYHWGRIFRHIQEGRFRPYFAFGLASLTFVHGLTVGHIWKMMDDPQWYDTVQKIYPDQWQWIADTRFAELYLTALALFLVILHLRGVLTGTANATWVFLGTVIVPTAALFWETVQIRAVAWQHYWMYGPKHW